jgi:hypothetical protein
VDCRNSNHSPFPVRLLRICRQIYHEAALKPFTQPTFDFGEFTVNSFVARLVPTQARAIAQIRLTGVSRLHWLSKDIPSRLRGLKHVEIHLQYLLVEFLGDHPLDEYPLNELARFNQGSNVEWLKNMGLKSMRFTTLIEGDVPKDSFKAAILELMKSAEDEILSKQQSHLTAD